MPGRRSCRAGLAPPSGGPRLADGRAALAAAPRRVPLSYAASAMRRLALACLVALGACVASLAACSAPTPPPVTVGSTCRTEEAAACDSAGPRMLVCRSASYVMYSDCRGPGGCRLEGDTVSCDTSGNSAGDTCPPQSEGKVRCDPDGGHDILRCVDGGLTAIYTCPTGTLCVFKPDAGLTCG